MADVFTKKKRSDIMSKAKDRGNAATELRLIRIFRENKITGWRRHVKLFGSPDFVFSKARLAIFIDGCFWHGCPLHATFPKTNYAFWKKKLEENKARDKVVNGKLKSKGWHVLRIWQHELYDSKNIVKRIRSYASGRLYF